VGSLEYVRVCDLQALLKLIPMFHGSTGETNDLLERPMKFNHLARTSAVMQSVDILRNDASHEPGLLHLSSREVGSVGPGGAKARPANH
jgi:hypothetical protein